ncbi:CRISPR-associated protein Cas4 [Methanimicrococcus hacksteinii]|uniref:CRISPR-associated protein Cas4 n=1 Tax=Methanimicrococcus hacksteinii TaxID=3028293 RepID=UPI00298EF95C|nr:Dna2/Cas4 domain-containing protein [Methanimicrococcus sp. At1]
MELPALVSEQIDENPDVVFAENNEFKKQLEDLRIEILKEQQEFEEKQTNVTEEAEEAEKAEQVRDKIEKLCANVDSVIRRDGTEIFEFVAAPINIEKTFYFPKADLTGTPPKVLMIDEKRLPYLIKISSAPSNGVWESDRITAAAYLMILKNEFGRQFVSDGAVIDYFGDYRMIRIRPQDRRKVFRAVRKIKDIKKGKMPREKNIFLCPKCVYREKCHVKAKTLFSKIFGEA